MRPSAREELTISEAIDSLRSQLLDASAWGRASNSRFPWTRSRSTFN
ncbi:hypothetical protein [Paractinoplanes durhamensis]